MSCCFFGWLGLIFLQTLLFFAAHRFSPDKRHLVGPRETLHSASDVLYFPSPQWMCVSPCRLRCSCRTCPWCCFAWEWWAWSSPGSSFQSCLWEASSTLSIIFPGQTFNTLLLILAFVICPKSTMQTVYNCQLHTVKLLHTHKMA